MLKNVHEFFKGLFYKPDALKVESWHDYYRDPNKIKVLIRYSFRIPSRIDSFRINENNLHAHQEGSEIKVAYEKIVSITLLRDLQKHFNDFRYRRKIDYAISQRNPSQYFVGYLKETLPRINLEIARKRYQEGHLILKNVSIFDIEQPFVFDKTSACAVLWPLPLPKFEDIPSNVDVVFVRDLIDAMTEYFYFNLDECIRKVITSVENYFLYYNLEPKTQPPPKSKFIRQVSDYITEDLYQYKERDLRIIRENILFIYELRNKIVHDKLRLNTDNTMICKKAIGTLSYIYQSKYTTLDGKRRHIFGIDGHFKMIADMVAPNLDRFEASEKSQREPEVISNEDEMDASMFRSLQIKDDEKKVY
ncbi:MAG TPA: hypothetical protein VJG48_03780 [Candidatus Paceibacterota bacterium]